MKHNFKKILSMLLTVCMLLGTMSALIPMTVSAAEAEPIYLEKNTTATINGITYRFDSDPSINPDSWARVNPDGTWEMSYRSGDILWFPDVELTADSQVRMDVTNTKGVKQDMVVSGLAYAVTAAENGGADKMVIGTTHTGGRFRIANSTFTSNNTAIPNDGFNGEGGKSDKITIYDTEHSSTWETNSAWTDVAPINKVIANGKTVTYSVKKNSDGTTALSYGAHYSTFVTRNLSASTYAFEGGAVGFTAVYSYNTTYAQSKIIDLTVKNCKVDGVSKSFSIYGEVVAPHTNVTVDGKVYRFDPLESSTESICVLKSDGTFRVTLQSGDLFWMPETQTIDGAFLSAKMITNNNQYNNGNLAAGIAYDIELGENGTWGDDDDSLINAHTQTSWRRRICSSTVAQRDSSCTKLGVQSTNTMASADRNEAYLAWGDRWACGNITNYSLSINESGNCYVSFMDENNVEMTYDYYAIDEANRKVMDGPIGFYSFWSGDSKERGYMTVEILELYSIVAEPEVSNAQASLSLDGTIGLNFGFDAANMPDGATVVVTKNGVQIANQAVVNGANVVTAPVNAKEMGDEINFSIMVDGALFDEHSYTTSVKAYADAMLANADYAEWHDLISAMLNYGAAAQKLLNYKTDALVADISNLDFDMTDVGSLYISGDTSILTALYATLTMESDTALNLYFKTVDGSAITTATVNGVAVDVVTTNDGFFRVTIADLAADELSDEQIIVVNESISITVSATEWAKLAVDGDESDDMKTLAKALAAYSAAADAKKNKQVISFDGQIATAADIAALRLDSDNKKAEIQNTANLTLSTGTFKKVYYVSSSEGSDSNNGTSSSTPFKTIAKVNSTLEGLSSLYSATVCFKRGDTWRGEQLVAVEDLTVTAYGTGAKPVIMASPENGGGSANASKWTDMGNNIWRYEGSNNWSDVGNIVFNDGESYAKKITQLYVMNEGWTNYALTDFTNAPAQTYTFESYTDLKNDLDFFHDKDFDGGSGATGYLYLCSTSNPATRFESIEFATDLKLVYIHHDNGVTIDNICFKYTGAHAVAADGQPDATLSDLTVQNCEFYWIGGSIQDRISSSILGTQTVAYDVRYGNAVEVYGQVDGYIVTNNYIYQVFDAGITVQKTMDGTTSDDWSQKNIQFTNNVLEYCNYSIEYFLTKIPDGNSSTMQNFVISGNYMWNAGLGFCETRPIWGRGFAAHIKCQFSEPCNKATGFEISDNVMVGTRDNFLQIRNSYGTDSMPLFENNTLYGYYDAEGTASNGYRIGEVRVTDPDTTDDDAQIWAAYDSNIDAYMKENMGTQYGEGNKYYFMF